MTFTPVGRLIFLNVRPKNIWFLRYGEDGNRFSRFAMRVLFGLTVGYV